MTDERYDWADDPDLGGEEVKRRFERLEQAPVVDQNLIDIAKAGVAGAVANVLREVYKTGTDGEIRVARRCWFAALEAAGLVPPVDRTCTCPDVDLTTFDDQPRTRRVKGRDPACPWHGDQHGKKSPETQ